MLRLVILKDVDNVVFEYTEKQVRDYIYNRTMKRLTESESFFKHSWSRGEVAVAIRQAFNELIAEFKEQTVSLV